MITALILAVWAMPDAVEAAPAPARDYGGFAAVLLLNDPALTPLLDLSSDQKERLDRELKTYLALLVERANLLRKEEQPSEEALAKLDADCAATSDRSTALLSPDQTTRLEEISWQLLGVDAFAMPGHAARLGVSREEADGIKPSIEKYSAEFTKLHAAFRREKTDYARFRTEAGRLEAAAAKEIASKLNAETRAEYERRCGAPAGLGKWDLRTHWPVAK